VNQVDALPTPLLARAATPFVALSGAANVIMQLSWPEVGHGVKDSRVVGALLFDDPERRRRTTVGYLAVAVHGTPDERAAFRRATNASHAQVRSLPGESPPYSAFDPELQRWVGSCIYRGFEEASEAVWGPLGVDREAFYREGVVFGGMLQMPTDLWPADRAAFARLWDTGLARASIDDDTRRYLLSVVRLEYLSRRVPSWLAERRIWLTTGFLPEQLRDQMHLPWSVSEQARFERFTRRFATTIRRSPGPVREFPFNRAISGVRERLASGRDLFEG